jgi:hypothetical protein
VENEQGTRAMGMELEDRYVKFSIEINPMSLLAGQILAVREQVVKEWGETDLLDVVGLANDRILDSYFKLARQGWNVRRRGMTSSS